MTEIESLVETVRAAVGDPQSNWTEAWTALDRLAAICEEAQDARDGYMRQSQDQAEEARKWRMLCERQREALEAMDDAFCELIAGNSLPDLSIVRLQEIRAALALSEGDGE